jgi:antibiotic biosynthesis monooxygenase (ABM) superfamily enzyme
MTAPHPRRPLPPAGSAPSVHVRVLATWLAVYPSITVAQLVSAPVLEPYAVPLRVLVITAVVVPLVVYVLVPRLLRTFAALPRPRRPARG